MPALCILAVCILAVCPLPVLPFSRKGLEYVLCPCPCFLAENTDTLTEIAHFPHIPRPVVTHQKFPALLGYCLQPAPCALMFKPHHPVRQIKDVLLPFSEGRKIEFKHIQTIQQILPEIPPGYLLL